MIPGAPYPGGGYRPKRFGAAQLLGIARENPGLIETMTPKALMTLAGGDSFDLFETRVALANMADPRMTAEDLRLTGVLDKGLAISQGMREIQEEVDGSAIEALDAFRERRNNLTDRLLQAGSLFP